MSQTDQATLPETGWALNVGDRVDGWKVEQVVDCGPVCCLVEARKRTKASFLKVVRPDVAATPHLHTRLQREVAARQRLPAHPGRVSVERCGACKKTGCWYVAFAIPAGITLAERLEQRGPLTPAEARHSFLALAFALQALHQRGVGHRVFFPETLVLSPDGTLTLADVSLSALEDVEAPARRTSPFIPPEIAAGSRADPRSDCYAVGTLLLFALLPRERRNAPLDEGGAPEEFQPLVRACRAAEPGARPADASHVVDSLRSPWPPLVVRVCRKLFGRVVHPRSGPYRSIAAALRSAEAGERIHVLPGVYRETLHLNRNVEIVAEGPAGQVILEALDASAVYSRADRALIRGLTIRLASEYRGSDAFVVDVLRGRLVLEDCDLSSGSLACVGIHGPESAGVVRDCKLHDSKQGGLFVYDAAAALAERCDISGNTLAGIEIKTQAHVVVRHCTIHDGKAGGLFVHEDGGGLVEHCELFANGLASFEIKKQGDLVVRHCTIHDGKQGGFYLHHDGTALIESCEIAANSLSGIQISTAQGAVVRRCRLRDGKGSGIFVADEGTALVEDCDIAGSTLAGIEIKEKARPVVRRCTIHDGKQGGIYVHKEGLGTIERCEVFANTFSGVEISEHGNPTVVRCRIHDNKQSGIYVHQAGEGTVEDCELADNGFAGVKTKDASRSVLCRCVVRGSKESGVHLRDQGSARLEDCEITASGEDGVCVESAGAAELRRCRIRDNAKAGIRVSEGSRVRAEECELSGNAGGAWHVANGATVECLENVESG